VDIVDDIRSDRGRKDGRKVHVRCSLAIDGEYVDSGTTHL